MTQVVDHLVLNNHFDLATARELFVALGFTLTPESHHTLGSSNQLIVFGDRYLELIGVPRHGQRIRQELLDSPPGIDGLVFRSEDAAQTERQLREQGFDALPVQHFSREVEADGERGEARFSAVRLAPGSFTAGRVYFCQHHTPEWIWRAPWQRHENGVSAMTTLTLVTDDIDSERNEWQRLGSTNMTLQLLTRADWHDFSAGLPGLDETRRSQFAAITFTGGELSRLKQAALRFRLPHYQDAERLLIALPALHTLLEFRL
ncbi:VOC family protein [Erwinia sp. 9145]|uniref:VOC family protein n=1 Tax=Erwinia sp. 9145 TaxID=1500895 RepID=UPI000551BE45|nr:VOC family protein [Erwinia sp. 9145]